MKNKKINQKKTEIFYSLIGESHVENIANQGGEYEYNLPMAEMDEWFGGYISHFEQTFVKEKKRHRWTQFSKVAAIVVGILSISFTGLFVGVEGFRATVFNSLMYEKETHTVVGNTNYDGMIEIGVVVPSLLAKEFTLVSYETIGKLHKSAYENGYGNFVRITQSDLETQIQFDTEEAYFEILKDKNRELMIIEKEGMISCYWQTKENSFSLISNLSKLEVMDIINSME